MNNEIKEILEEIQRLNGYVELGYDKAKLLLDFITTLEKEKQAIKERCEYLQRSCDRKEEQMLNYREEYLCQEDYKSRIDKAIDYITTEQLYTNYQWGKSQYVKILKDLLNILQGEDKE